MTAFTTESKIGRIWVITLGTYYLKFRTTTSAKIITFRVLKLALRTFHNALHENWYDYGKKTMDFSNDEF